MHGCTAASAAPTIFKTTKHIRLCAGFFISPWADFPMVDFNNETRKRCRHCKMRLPEPTSNEREAFCAPGCYRSFYLHRCRVCEKPIEQKRDGRRMLCKRSACRNAFLRNFAGGRYLSPSAPSYASKTLILLGLKRPPNPTDMAYRSWPGTDARSIPCCYGSGRRDCGRRADMGGRQLLADRGAEPSPARSTLRRARSRSLQARRRSVA